MGVDMATLKRINQDDLRNHNLSVVLNQVLRSPQPLSRADLAKATGLTKATMSLLVSLLIEHGVLREGVPLVQAVYGRPSTRPGVRHRHPDQHRRLRLYGARP